MELIIQDEAVPGVVLDALLSIADQQCDHVRIAVAYTTQGGTDLLVPQWKQRIGDAEWDALPKDLVTSVDYGLTDPNALAFWAEQPNTQVWLANAHLLEAGHLRPARAFHPKLYSLDQADGQSVVVGSANLTRRALTVNSEAVAIARQNGPILSAQYWDRIEQSATPFNEQLLQRYRELRAPTLEDHADDPPTAVEIQPDDAQVFPDEVEAGRLDPSGFDRFWVEAGSMTTGGSRNILEVPRYANRFFGFVFDEYPDEHVVIGYPTLTLGRRRWDDRRLAWHGAPGMNKMERLTLPTAAQGGPAYSDTCVLFRRHAAGFEIEVADWNSAIAIAWRNASADAERVYRLGRGARVCGLL